MNKSKIWTLIKYFVSIDFFAISSIKQNIFKKGKKSNAIQGIISILVYLFLYIFLAPKIGKFLANSINSPIGAVYLTSIFASIFMITLFFSLASSFIFIEKNNESEMLLSLPISGSDIIKGSIYALCISFFLRFYIIFIVAFFSVGYYLKKSILYYILIILTFGIINTLAVLISGIIILIFGKLIRISKLFNRFLKLIYSLFMICIFLAYMLFTQSYNSKVLFSISSVLTRIDNTISKIFFMVSWAKNIVIFKDITSVLLSFSIGILCLIVVYLIFNFLSKRNYLEILRCANIVSKESNKVIEKRKKLGVSQVKQSKFTVLFKKEFFEILTTPTYLMQIVIIDILLLIFTAVGIYFGLEQKDTIAFLINSFMANIDLKDILLYSFATGAIVGLYEGLSSLTTSSVSREGKAFWVIASAPINIHTQILSRICACQFLHFAIMVVVLLASLTIYIFNPLVYIVALLGFCLTLFISGALNMILGLINPNFDWKTPREAINNGATGLSTFGSILINYGMYALMIFTAYFGMKRNMDIRFIIIIDIAIAIITGIISYLVDYKLYKRVLKRL